jgi:hypothetical protein
MPINPERSKSWTPPFSLGKRYAIDLSPLENDEPYTPTSAKDAIATIRDSGMFQHLDGYAGQSAMIEEEARNQFPECFGLGRPTQPERKVTSIQEAAAKRELLYAATHYVVQQEVLEPSATLNQG